MSAENRAPGRPRSREADNAILGAALELLTERGVEATSIEQVARRAGVTRATVYRRFPDKTRLLLATIEAAYGDPPRTPEIRDVEHLLVGWASVLANPRQRRLLRRLYGAIEDYPGLARAYRDLFGRERDQTRRNVLEQARDRGQLPEDADLDVVLDLLTGAVWQHLATRPDTCTPSDVEQFLRAVLHQVGYRPGAQQHPAGQVGYL
ncbi:TetR family transcriptional regulator [Saccharopolyspora subtropica]|uniref:TetR family transcriptional regulator n=1 Tax=Saccharopolyspora thermophila TaxID=89367 RepID=A0A917K0J1_9PSEU|nr:TetR/AcrR family transcriptional regulator [Saccharopolyspora subtropica]GGI92107.1 TetR family transcriptional regulator [Saccharopolyspora subtropica]